MAGSWNVGLFGEFIIEPTWEAICVPNPHPSGGVALSLIATHRPQSLFVAVTKHWPGAATARGDPGLPAVQRPLVATRGGNGTHPSFPDMYTKTQDTS